MGVTMKGILFSTAAAASLFSVRGDNPFWYQDLDPATNRAAISSAVATSPTAMESRLISVENSEKISFTTYPCGLAVLIR